MAPDWSRKTTFLGPSTGTSQFRWVCDKIVHPITLHGLSFALALHQPETGSLREDHMQCSAEMIRLKACNEMTRRQSHMFSLLLVTKVSTTRTCILYYSIMYNMHVHCMSMYVFITYIHMCTCLIKGLNPDHEAGQHRCILA